MRLLSHEGDPVPCDGREEPDDIALGDTRQAGTHAARAHTWDVGRGVGESAQQRPVEMADGAVPHPTGRGVLGPTVPGARRGLWDAQRGCADSPSDHMMHTGVKPSHCPTDTSSLRKGHGVCVYHPHRLSYMHNHRFKTLACPSRDPQVSA